MMNTCFSMFGRGEASLVRSTVHIIPYVALFVNNVLIVYILNRGNKSAYDVKIGLTIS